MQTSRSRDNKQQTFWCKCRSFRIMWFFHEEGSNSLMTSQMHCSALLSFYTNRKAKSTLWKKNKKKQNKIQRVFPPRCKDNTKHKKITKCMPKFVLVTVISTSFVSDKSLSTSSWVIDDTKMIFVRYFHLKPAIDLCLIHGEYM